MTAEELMSALLKNNDEFFNIITPHFQKWMSNSTDICVAATDVHPYLYRATVHHSNVDMDKRLTAMVSDSLLVLIKKEIVNMESKEKTPAEPKAGKTS